MQEGPEGQFVPVPDSNTNVQPPVSPVPPRRPLVVRIFIGPNGLRAGWRLLVYVVIVFLLGGLFGWAAGLRHRQMGFTPLRIIASDGVMFAALYFGAVIMSFIERRKVGEYGLPGRTMFGARFWEGALWGFLAITIVLLSIKATGAYTFGPISLSAATAAYYAGMWAVAFVLVGLAEEYLLRGYTLFTLTTGIRFWPSAILLSLVFALLHWSNPGETWLGLTEVAAIGLVFCFSIRRTGTLWFAVGLHFAWDWGQTFFYGVPDSGLSAPGHLLSPSFHGPWWITGGTVGPEGSIYSILVTILLAVLINWRFPNVRYPRTELPVTEVVPIVTP